jgi:hypothetical protein
VAGIRLDGSNSLRPVSVRNAAPGSPPIGPLIDYAAFFWAEGIIAASLVTPPSLGFAPR